MRYEKGVVLPRKVGPELGNLIRKHKDIGLLDDPDFKRTRKCHDWRNYIPDEVRAVWPDMTMESRVMIYIVADKQAMAEDWD